MGHVSKHLQGPAPIVWNIFRKTGALIATIRKNDNSQQKQNYSKSQSIRESTLANNFSGSPKFKKLIQERIGRSWFAIGKLRPIFISKMSDASKMRPLKATVGTIAAYGLESFPMTPSLCGQTDASHRQMVRAALGITWPGTISTAELPQRDKLTPLSGTLCKRRLRLVGHVIRIHHSHITNNCTLELPPPTRSSTSC